MAELHPRVVACVIVLHAGIYESRSVLAIPTGQRNALVVIIQKLRSLEIPSIERVIYYVTDEHVQSTAVTALKEMLHD